MNKNINLIKIKVYQILLKKIYEKHDIKYKPRINTKFIRVKYLLQKLREIDDIDKSLYNHFQTSLSERNKLYHKIPNNEMNKFEVPLITL